MRAIVHHAPLAQPGRLRGWLARAVLSAGCGVFSLSCHARHSRRQIVDPDLGTIGALQLSDRDLADDLVFLRAHAEGKTAPAPRRARAIPGSRVFVSIFVSGSPRVLTTGLGTTLADSLTKAGDVAHAITPAIDFTHARLQLDIVTRLSPVTPKAKPADGIDRPGRFGRIVRGGQGHFGYVLPGELFTLHMLGEESDPTIDVGEMNRLLTARSGGECPACDSARFETASVVESTGGALRLIGGLPPRPDPEALDREKLLHHVTIAADYLARMVSDQGRFVYIYDAIADREIDDDYSTIRHAGATDALLESYGALHDERYLAAAERALGYLDSRLSKLSGEGDEPERIFLGDSDNAFGPIGGTGLTLIAFSAHAAVTKKDDYLPRMQAMGRFLVRQLESNGHFAPFFAEGIPVVKEKEVLYYPGEAMLGLLRLYRVDPQPMWLEAAERAAHYRLSTDYVHAHDRHRDYWFALTLTELAALTHDPIYAERALEIALGTMKEQDEEEADVAAHPGAYDALPRANPTSVALEAECAIASMVAGSAGFAQGFGRDDAMLRTLTRHARRAASFVTWMQFDEAGGYFLPNLPKALGGIHGNPWGGQIRIDDDQHAIMGFLSLFRVSAESGSSK